MSARTSGSASGAARWPSRWASDLARVSTTAAALVVLLLFLPALEAPFLVPKFAALEIAASLGFLAVALRVGSGELGGESGAVVGASLAVLATSGLAWLAARGSHVETPYAMDALLRLLAPLGLACGVTASCEATAQRLRLLEAITLAAGVVALLGLLQHVDACPVRIPIISVPGSTFGNRNLAAEVVAMTLPLGVAATLGASSRGASIPFGVMTSLELVYLAVTRARGAWLGAACAGVVLILLLARGRAWRVSKARAGVVGVVLAIAVVAAWLPGRFNPRDAGDAKRYSAVLSVLEGGIDASSPALRTRLGIWRRTLRMASEHPWLGVGPGNWPVSFPRYAGASSVEEGVLTATLAPRQAHNDLLERLGETGIVGAAALAVFAVVTLRDAGRRVRAAEGDDRLVGAGATASLVAMGVISLAGFPLEMPGTLTVAGLALGLSQSTGTRHATVAPSAWRRLWVAPALALLAICAVRAERGVRASRWERAAEGALRSDSGVAGAEAALEALGRARAANGGSYLDELRTAQMELRKRQPAAAERAARRALLLEPYAPNAWGVLAMAVWMDDRPRDALDASSHALSSLADYPYALDVRARALRALGDDVGAAAASARVRALAEGSSDEATRRAARRIVEAEPTSPPARTK